MKTLTELENERFAWSLITFPEANEYSSLLKCEGEIDEIKRIIVGGEAGSLAEEYADALMCLFDSAGRAGITIEQLTEAYHHKLEKNKKRTWVKNRDNTYSHVK